MRYTRRNPFRVASSKHSDAFSQGCQSVTLGWNWLTLSALLLVHGTQHSALSTRNFS